MNNAIKLQKIISSHGHKILAAGGFVRDYLLGLKAKDIDLATSALPEEVVSILKEHNIQSIPTGLKHGTITAVMDKTPYEITTLRVDKICHGRDADVEFVSSFEEDAKRRDLTINALFMDLETKEIFDYVDGKRDIENKVLRFVGDPEKRIKEDCLRILRFYRFYSNLGFIPEEESLKACKKFLPYLCYVSSERIRDEVSKMVIGGNIQTLFLDNQDMVSTIFPEIKPIIGFDQKGCYYHDTDVYNHTLRGLKELSQRKYADPVLSIAHLFHDVAKPFCHTHVDGSDHFYGHEVEGEPIVDKVMSRLKFSSKEISRAKFLVRNHMRLNNNLSKKALRRLLHDCEEYGDRLLIKDLWKIHMADCHGMINQSIYPEDLINEILEEKKDVFKCPLSGKDLINEFGLKEGAVLGKILRNLKELVVNGELSPDDKTAARVFVEKQIEELNDGKS